jgi:peroxiredoxin family protein
MKNKLVIILYSEEKEKLNYALGILATAAALGRDTELFLAGKSLFSFLKNKKKSNLNYSNSNELLLAILELKIKFSICSGALVENKIKESNLREDIIFEITGLTAILAPKKQNDQIIFI